jgi:hypothetical protein
MEMFEKFPDLPKHKMSGFNRNGSTDQSWNATDAAL